ncbi:unnamed protein product [Clonostachys chloroleuca]|uniref:Rhodopsin domain-containing protein n=1 Tax=Clonostachys chloroleuca TaxID=1926264 RepID=A0AA35Q334_9HYPO|nr:unnamed protein product [Clonostachys chloroleuca]
MDLSDNRGPTIIAVGYSTWAVAIATLVLRLASRKVRGVKLGIEDWLILASIPFSLVHVVFFASYGVQNGFGKHVLANKIDSVRNCAFALFIGEVCYIWTLCLVKLSILAFYWRTFGIEKSIRIPIIAIGVITLIWAVGVFLTSMFRCRPVRANWEQYNLVHPMPKSEYVCDVERFHLYYGSGIPSIVTDFAVVVLPTPYIWKLQLPKSQKIAISGILLVGLFVTAVSIVRLKMLLVIQSKNLDVTWNAVDAIIWQLVEPNVSIVCGRVPIPQDSDNCLPKDLYINWLHVTACVVFIKPILGKLGEAVNLSKLSLLTSFVSSNMSKGQSTTSAASANRWYASGQDTENISMNDRPATYMADENILPYRPEPGYNRSSIELQSLAAKPKQFPG